MPKRRATNYTGELAKPIPHIVRPSLSSPRYRTIRQLGGIRREPLSPEEVVREHEVATNLWLKKCSAARTKKLPALFRHYGIEQGDFARLALALAKEHVPGFRMAEGPVGPRKVWQPFDTALLKAHIDDVRARKPRISELRAAEVVAKSGIWDSKTRGRSKGTSLLRRAAMADDFAVQIVRDTIRKHEPPVTFEQFVRNWLAP